MAETTKRAIRENMAITSQLKKMSTKTMELLSENESLLATVAKLKMDNSLLVESERDLARKNQANQVLPHVLFVASCEDACRKDQRYTKSTPHT
jgi:hypothetical protein